MSEEELHQVIKLGKASQAARELAEEGSVGDGASQALLGEYTPLTPANALTARTPAATDNVLAGAQDLMALTHVDTPLKGGLNTPLHQPQLGQLGPAAPPTPNALLSTPFRTPSIVGGDSTPATPGSIRSMAGSIATATPGATPLRDQLAINAEGALVPADTVRALKQYQRAVRSSLQDSLSSLPTPANDFEIVVPDQDPEHLGERDDNEMSVEDQADIDARRAAELEAKRVAELKRRSQCVQRDMPRPQSVNKSVLRPSDAQYTDLQKAEEMIKREMVIMLHYDALHSPLATFIKKTSQDSAHAEYIQTHPYRNIADEDIAVAKKLLQKEMQVSFRYLDYMFLLV